MQFNKYKPFELFDILKKRNSRIFLLFGSLGEGKTTFVKNFLNNEEVTSPTFSICHEYSQNGEKICHFDLYRIEDDPIKIENSGLFDALKNYKTFIEWPEKISMEYYKPFLNHSALLRFDNEIIYLM